MQRKAYWACHFNCSIEIESSSSHVDYTATNTSIPLGQAISDDLG